jgi:hypothetical protein
VGDQKDDYCKNSSSLGEKTTTFNNNKNKKLKILKILILF